jgi:hypothetical protein
VDELAKLVAEAALRLAALPPEGSRNDLQALDAIEQLGLRILKEVAAARQIRTRTQGETRGMWRIMEPVRRV